MPGEGIGRKIKNFSIIKLDEANKMNHLTRFTDFLAPSYDLIFKTFWLGRERNFRQKVIDLMDLSGDESILDIGCGTGTLTSMIADKMNGRGGIFGVDLSPRMVELAKKKASQNGRPVEYRVASSLALPFDDATFDAVVTSLVYHHLMSLVERAKTLSEIWRVLKTGGRYVATEFTKFTLGNLWVVHDSLIGGIGLFNTGLLEENGFHIRKRMETSRGIMIILVAKAKGDCP